MSRIKLTAGERYVPTRYLVERFTGDSIDIKATFDATYANAVENYMEDFKEHHPTMPPDVMELEVTKYALILLISLQEDKHDIFTNELVAQKVFTTFKTIEMISWFFNEAKTILKYKDPYINIFDPKIDTETLERIDVMKKSSIRYLISNRLINKAL
jgi:hypothetical protein